MQRSLQLLDLGLRELHEFVSLPLDLLQSVLCGERPSTQGVSLLTQSRNLLLAATQGVRRLCKFARVVTSRSLDLPELLVVATGFLT